MHAIRFLNPRPLPAGGFTLVEVMVAVFVMTIGLLGIAALQITSKQTNFEALERMTASHLAQETLERIRANPDQLAVYTNAGLGREFDTVSTAAACDGAGENCLASQLADFDLHEISLAITGVSEQLLATPGDPDSYTPTGGLVSPRLCIEGPAVPPGNITVAVSWRGATALGSTPAHTCGAEAGLYDASNGEAGVYRRVLSVDAYLE